MARSIPQGSNGVGLSQLDDDRPGAQLVAGVAGIPVVVARVAVEQGIPATAHTFNDTGTRCNGRHVLTGHCGHWVQGRVMAFFCSHLHLFV